ncbi:hypothetical protein ACL02R_18200 [Streptomyces sp. MS19]|uniref:hypothetical protein n=1 Tax=Streptomyces sp. MS19 TaxID=3385972 RepID=UPI0039A30E67
MNRLGRLAAVGGALALTLAVASPALADSHIAGAEDSHIADSHIADGQVLGGQVLGVAPKPTDSHVIGGPAD